MSGHGGAQGAFELKVMTFPDTSKRNNAANPPFGWTASGNIWPTSNIGYHRITLSAQTDVIIRGSGDLHTKAELQNSSRTMVTSNDDGLLPPRPLPVPDPAHPGRGHPLPQGGGLRRE